MSKSDSSNTSKIDFNILADQLNANGYEGLDLNLIYSESAQLRKDSAIRKLRKIANAQSLVVLAEPEHNSDDLQVYVEGEDEYIDRHNAQIVQRQKARKKQFRARKLPPRIKKPVSPYPTCLPDFSEQRSFPVPVGLFRYPLTCTDNADAQHNMEYIVKRNGRTEYARITRSPDDINVTAPDYTANTILHYLLFGLKRGNWSTNGFQIKDGRLISAPINHIRRDLYGDKGPSHSQFKKQLNKALISLKYTSYYWRRFYGMQGDKTVNLEYIVEDFKFEQAAGGRKEIRLVVLFSNQFLDIIDTTQQTHATAYRKLSLDELLHCKTAYSRRLYELVMMDICTIARDYQFELKFDDFRGRFGLVGTMRNRPSQVLLRVQDTMNTYVTRIIGASFDYSGRNLMFRNGDNLRVRLHVNITDETGIKLMKAIKDHDDDVHG